MGENGCNPAEVAAEETRARVEACLDAKKCFRLEAGAGAGKTHSLIEALHYIIRSQGRQLQRKRQQVACITYTNVAVEEIVSRTDGHPVVHASTIHSFCWTMLQNFQRDLRAELPTLNEWWVDKLAEVGGLGQRAVTYDEFGRHAIGDAAGAISHNDVLELMARLLTRDKFCVMLAARFPIVFIDEYQDTDRIIAAAMKVNILDRARGPLIGLFGDHWQKIYGTGCGRFEHDQLTPIDKHANFRSAKVIVDCLNGMRPELPQQPRDAATLGTANVYHTNRWVGTRRTGSHWAGDLPEDDAAAYLERLKTRLADEGWDFSFEKTKILMLTHSVLAARQGYAHLAAAFSYNDSFIKKEDPHVAFLVDAVEPVCVAYEQRKCGEMFAALGARTPAVRTIADKREWTRDVDELLRLRTTGTVGAVVDLLRRTCRPSVPDAVERRERERERLDSDPSAEVPTAIADLRKFRNVQYQEVVRLREFINDKTPFSTKHGVKGAQFENVLAVFGRGWNQYNFGQFLESVGSVPPDRQESYERNRNLFYVACSRPKMRLAVMFTQLLTDRALCKLGQWFGASAIHAL